MDTKNYFILGLILLLAVIGFTAFTQINGLKHEKSSLQEEMVSFQTQVRKAMEENKGLQKQLSDLTSQIQALSQEKAVLEKSLQDTGAERDGLKSRVGRLEEELKQKELAESQQDKVLPAGETAYWARVLKQKTNLELEVERLKGALNDAQAQNEELIKEKSSVQMDFSSLSTDSSELKRELEYNTRVLDNMTEELAREKTDKYRVAESFKMLRSENAALRQQVKSLSGRKAELTHKVSQLQGKNEELQNRLGRMEVLVKDRLLQLDSLKKDLGLGGTAVVEEKEDTPAPAASQSFSARSFNPGGDSFLPPVVPGNDIVQLQPIVVTSQTETRAQPSPGGGKRGNVLAVNAESRFVIVNVGENSGVSIGDRLAVADRQNQPKGELEVIQVRKNIAACDIVSEHSPLIVGDSVY